MQEPDGESAHRSDYSSPPRGRRAASASPSYDVAVVGAGPGGAACALELARSGARVVLVDRDAPPRYKTCGGGLIWRARQTIERELGVDLGPVIEVETHAADLILEDPHLVFRVSGRRPPVTMTFRADLDRRLAEAATASGAELAAPCRVRELNFEEGAVVLRTTRGPLRARFLVAADGAGGRLAGWAGFVDDRRLVPALESELVVSSDLQRRFAGSARFDFGPVPGGYAWVFPKRRGLSVGCLTTRPGRRALRRDLEAYLGRLGLDRPRRRDDHGFVIPVRPRGQLARGRVLLIGDAAGLADPVTCEGISAALDSGRRAARALIEAGDDPAEVRRAYCRDLEADLLPELRRARLLARALYGAPRLRRLAFRRLGQPLAEAVGRVMTGEATYRDLGGSPTSLARLALALAGWRDRR